MWLKSKSKEKKQFANDLVLTLTFKHVNCFGNERVRYFVNSNYAKALNSGIYIIRVNGVSTKFVK